MDENQPQNNMKKRNLSPIIGVVVVILAVAGYFAVRASQKNMVADSSQNTSQNPPVSDTMPSMTDPATQNAATPPVATTPAAPATPATPAPAAEKTFTVVGSNFSFAPAKLTVNKGDKVKIVFQNSGGFHDFVIDEFNVKTDTIASGTSATVEFTADKTGTFDYYCSVGNHRAMGMQGVLTVQ